MKIRVEKQEKKKVVLNEDELGFGRVFAYKMLEMDYDPR